MKILIGIFLIGTLAIQSQEVEYTYAEKDTMMKRKNVYPGCKYFIKNNEALYHCINRKFNRDLGNELLEFDLEPGSDTIVVRIKFHVNKEGLIELDSIRSNDISGEFESNAIQAFYKVKNNLESEKYENDRMLPAMNMNDEPMIIKYEIPVRFVPAKLSPRFKRRQERALRRQERKRRNK